MVIIGAVLCLSRDADQLGTLNEYLQHYLADLLPGRVLAVLAEDEAKCRFVLDFGRMFADCGPPKPDPLSALRLHPLDQSEPWGFAGTVLKQPGVFLQLVQDTLGLLAIPLFAASIIVAIMLSIQGLAPLLVYVSMPVSMFLMYLMLLVAALVLFGLSIVLGQVLGFLAWVWGGIAVVATVVLLPRELLEKSRHFVSLLRAGSNQA